MPIYSFIKDMWQTAQFPIRKIYEYDFYTLKLCKNIEL